MTAAREPRVIVCAGGGGVGKTTASAALALALARRGRTTLIVTIDPARRLAGAMGVPLTDEVRTVELPSAGGRLAALMPDPRGSLRTFVEHLFEGEPAAKARLLDNRLYAVAADAAAGVHELVAMNLLARASEGGRFDAIVIDTAPSRHAIDFVTYPGRLAALLGGRTVAWLAGLAQRAAAAPSGAAPEAQGGGVPAWGTGRIESLIARVTGPNLVRDMASLFGDLSVVRERFVALARRAADLLLGERAAYTLVAAPTAAARDDVDFLTKRLGKLGRSPVAIVLNRADGAPAAWARVLREHARELPPAVLEALKVLDDERASRAAAADAVFGELRKKRSGTAIVRLPHVEASQPVAIVTALADALDPHLPAIVRETA